MRKLILNLTVSLLLATAMIPQALAQTRTVTGTVRDEKGNALAAATVTVKGSKISTTTDGDGRFTFSAPLGAKTLQISYVGMQPLELGIPSGGDVQAVLHPATANLGDVVVVAYGTVKKKDLTGSVSVLKGDDLLKGNPTNVVSGMQGKIAGAAISQSDGAPGAGLNITIRGSNSFLSTQPLFVVDGIPYVVGNSDATPSSVSGGELASVNALSFINPNDVESISILKDASATALYGSRGANGVVIITTKKGRKGEDKVELNANLGVSKVLRTIKMLDAYGYATMQNEAYSNANFFEPAATPRNLPYPGEWQKSPTNPDSLVYFKGPKDFIGQSHDWQHQIFQTGITNNYSLNFSGANEGGSYLVSGGYIKQTGVIQNSRFEQFNVRANITRNIKKWLVFGSNTNFSKSTNQMVKTNNEDLSGGVGVVKAALAFAPTAPLYDSGTNNFTAATQISNPYVYVHAVKNQVLVSQIFSSNYLEATLAKGLTLRQNVGISYYNNQREQYYPRSVNEGLLTNGLAYQSQGWYNSITSETILNYAKTIGDHSLTFMAGSTYEDNQYTTKNQKASNFVNDQLQDNNLSGGAQNTYALINNKGKSNLASFIVRVTENWKDRYLLTLSYRDDGTSKFRPKLRWSQFPSGAFAWKLSNEPFLQDRLGAVNDAKIRVGYGRTGNQGISPYLTMSKLIPYPYTFNGTVSNGYADDYYAGPGNVNLKWETTDQYDIGLDLGIWKNRVTLTLDLYYKKTHDLLQNITIPPTTGFGTQYVNRGEVENKGLELSISAIPITNHDFTWNLSGNFTINRNKLLSLGGGVTQQFATRINTNGDQPFVQQVGHPIGALYGYVEQDIYKNEAEVRSDPVMANQPDAIIARTVGEIRYKDLDHNGAITAKDQTFIGDVNPKFTYGVTNSFTYKNFDLNFLIQGVYGNDIINMNTYYLSNIGGFNNVTQKMWDERWTFQNWEHAKSPKAEQQYWRGFKFSRRFIENGSYIRLRNLTLGYNVNLRSKGIQTLRVFATANNLVTITKYTGFDPDINGYGDDPSRRGVDMGGYPSSRVYNFGVQCIF
ncbi:MAG: TonB-dependent receptor [Chitinophagaceae bacterium]|nr:TonB-dependent receptor [Chitinophagaceae bacterium]